MQSLLNSPWTIPEDRTCDKLQQQSQQIIENNSYVASVETTGNKKLGIRKVLEIMQIHVYQKFFN